MCAQLIFPGGITSGEACRRMGGDDGRVAIRDRLRAGLAAQLRRPHGLAGWGVGSMLNRANRANVTAAVEALAPAPGEVGADIGFGGGLGLTLLLDRVGPAGRVHGWDISRVMLARARRRHRGAVADGRLELHQASIADLPIDGVSVDAAMSINTIYFVDDEAFGRLARTVSGHGRLVIGLGDPAAMAQDPVTAHGFRIRPLADVVAILGAAGLTLVDHHRVGPSPDAFHLLVTQPDPDRTPGPAN
jgi:arsenite methyltransferase